MNIVVGTIITIVLLFGLVVFRGAPYVPSRRSDLRRALDELYPLGKRDVLLDIGSGDGIVLRAASQRGARAIGYELNPILVWVSRFLSRGDKNVEVRLADLWRTKFPKETTVVYLFAVERDKARLTRKMQHEANRLGRPLAVISYGSELNATIKHDIGAHHLYEFLPLQSEKP